MFTSDKSVVVNFLNNSKNLLYSYNYFLVVVKCVHTADIYTGCTLSILCVDTGTVKSVNDLGPQNWCRQVPLCKDIVIIPLMSLCYLYS